MRVTHGVIRTLLGTASVTLLLLLLALGGREKAVAPVFVAAPIVVPAARPARPPGTTVLILRLGARGLELVSAIEKTTPCETSSEGTGLWCLEDATTGARLAEGCCDLPELCACSIGHDHANGCVVMRHEAVFRLKVPRRAARERIRILAADGRERGSFLLESSP